MSDLVGCRVGDYQVLRRLGSGGMADVYAARHLALHRDVAFKVLRSEHRGSHDDLKRFRREAQAAAQLNHPAIVQVYEIGDADGQHFIAQELVDGVNLNQWLQRDGQLSAASAIEVMRRVAEALQVAHEAGITHRDIKPENIMRADDGTIKVTDFGLARILSSAGTSTANLTRAGLTLGTPRYMSPEQIQGHAVDGRSDLYSLGVTLYHLLAGSPPFDADEPLALAVKHLHETPPPLDHARGGADLPAWLVATVMRMLQKAPQTRMQSATELLEILRENTETPAAGVGAVASGKERPLAAIASAQGRFSEPATGTASSAAPEPVSLLGTAHPSLGPTSATIQLQRITDAIGHAEQHSRRRGLWLMLIAVLGGLAGLGAVIAARPDTLMQTLRGTTVAQADDIQQQYLLALTRNDAAGWQAVLAYFPLRPDSPQARVQADYHDKARLQLARLWIGQQRYEEASGVLAALGQRSASSSLHQAIALTLQYEIAVGRGDAKEQAQLKDQLRRSLLILEQETPLAMQTFRAVVPERKRRELGLLD